MDPKGLKDGSFFPKGLDRLAYLRWKTESEILSKYIVVARKQLLFIYRSWMLSIYIYRFYFEKLNYILKTIYKSPLFVCNYSTKTWVTIACPVLKLFSCQCATSVESIKSKLPVVAWAFGCHWTKSEIIPDIPKGSVSVDLAN